MSVVIGGQQQSVCRKTLTGTEMLIRRENGHVEIRYWQVPIMSHSCCRRDSVIDEAVALLAVPAVEQVLLLFCSNNDLCGRCSGRVPAVVASEGQGEPAVRSDRRVESTLFIVAVSWVIACPLALIAVRWIGFVAFVVE